MQLSVMLPQNRLASAFLFHSLKMRNWEVSRSLENPTVLSDIMRYIPAATNIVFSSSSFPVPFSAENGRSVDPLPRACTAPSSSRC